MTSKISTYLEFKKWKRNLEAFLYVRHDHNEDGHMSIGMSQIVQLAPRVAQEWMKCKYVLYMKIECITCKDLLSTNLMIIEVLSQRILAGVL